MSHSTWVFPVLTSYLHSLSSPIAGEQLWEPWWVLILTLDLFLTLDELCSFSTTAGLLLKSKYSLSSGVCYWCITTDTLAVCFFVVLVFVFKGFALAEVG